MRDLEVSVRWDREHCVLALEGEARLETVSAFDALAVEIAERGVRHVILDMRALAFMDSASMGSLIRLNNNLAVGDGKLVLFGLQRMVSRLIERLGLHQLVIVETEEEALAALA